MSLATRPPQASTSPSLDQRKHIEEYCLRFEDAQAAGAAPRLEDFLAAAPDALRPFLFRELLRLELSNAGLASPSGAAPKREDYLRRFPEAADVVEEVWRERGGLPEPRPIPRALGRYEVLRELGRGGFGTVYLARDGALGREVALKVPHRASPAGEEDLARLLQEARSAAQLKHPAILPIYDVGEAEDGTPYIVMPYIAGPTLRDALAGGRPPLEQTVRWVRRLAEGLAFAHEQGYVHRDLTPGNVLLDEGQPLIADLGLAVHEQSQRTMRPDWAGSLPYMAPEQLRGESEWLDGRADIWALGVVLYQLLTGRVPFGATEGRQLSEEILYRDPKPPRQICKEVPRELEQICLRCLAKPIAERYATASDLAHALDQLCPSLQAAETGRLAFLRRHGRRAILSAALLLLVAAAAWYLRGPGQAAIPLDSAGAELDVVVWNGQRLPREGADLFAPEVVPLAPGDRIRLGARVDRPAYLYLIGISATGEAIPLYPWLNGDWQQRPPQEEPQPALSLPADLTQAWPVEPGPAGMETLVMLAADRPLPSDFRLPDKMPGLQPQTTSRYQSAVLFRNGERIHRGERPGRRTRGAAFQHTIGIDDPVLLNQQWLYRHWGGPGRLLLTVSFPVMGD